MLCTYLALGQGVIREQDTRRLRSVPRPNSSILYIGRIGILTGRRLHTVLTTDQMAPSFKRSFICSFIITSHSLVRQAPYQGSGRFQAVKHQPMFLQCTDGRSTTIVNGFSDHRVETKKTRPQRPPSLEEPQVIKMLLGLQSYDGQVREGQMLISQADWTEHRRSKSFCSSRTRHSVHKRKPGAPTARIRGTLTTGILARSWTQTCVFQTCEVSKLVQWCTDVH